MGLRPDRRALIGYLSLPFHGRLDDVNASGYSSGIRVLEMARALNRLGYVVDAFHYEDTKFAPERQYDVFVGMLESFSRCAQLLPSAIKVYYATRAHYSFHEPAQRQRVLDLEMRKGPLPQLRELEDVVEGRDIALSDRVVALGSDFTVETYRRHHSSVSGIDTAALRVPMPDLLGKRFECGRTNFLYLASWPFVKKGLDRVLEVFARKPHLNLWICGPVQSERGLLRIYRRELFYTSNIRVLGWAEVQSEWFAREVASKCAFSVFPSCAEGSAGAVINAMAHGIIPVASVESGVDLSQVGVCLKDCSLETIAATVEEVSRWDPERCRAESRRVYTEATTRYTAERFGQRFESIIREVLSNRRSGAPS